MEFDLVGNKEGIGSRLKNMLSIMRLNEGCKIVWIPTHCCNCNWNDLFENDMVYPRDIDRKNPRIYYSWRWYLTQEERRFYGYKYIDYLFEKTPAHLKAAYISQIEKLTPVKYIRKTVNEYAKMFDENTLSVSVRTWWDVKGSNLERKHDIDDFFKIVDENLRDKIFLTSDRFDAIEKFKQRYGNRVFTYKERVRRGNWSTATGVQDSLVECYLMGKANKMIITWHSAYNEIQWWLGGAKAEVIEVCKWK